ncbi:MAG: hypothetical protein ACFFAH_07850, partial [Promethearchaeota archaeon]
MAQNTTALERVLTVLEGKIPDKIPSFCLGGDFDFVDKFMKSQYALTDADMKQLEKDKISYRIPYIHAIIAKFSPPEILAGGLDAKIDLCWQNPNMPLPIKLDTLNDFVMYNGGYFKIVVRDEGIPHWWYAGPALLKKENIEQYWTKEKDLRPDESSVKNFAKIRKTMLKKYDIVVAQGQPGPFENCIFGIGHANFARLAR